MVTWLDWFGFMVCVTYLVFSCRMRDAIVRFVDKTVIVSGIYEEPPLEQMIGCLILFWATILSFIHLILTGISCYLVGVTVAWIIVTLIRLG